MLLQELTSTDYWDIWGLQVLESHARVLELCVGESPRSNIKSSALLVTWRGLRKAFSSPDTRKGVIEGAIQKLCSKGSQPSAKNAVMLGAIAGTCARKPDRSKGSAGSPSMKECFENKKSEYYTFYVREVIGSRTSVPTHISSALGDFFKAFATKEDIEKDIIPALEKALLRAPEIVLNDLVTPLFHSLPDSIDLTNVLKNNLLKALLSNIKSTNAAIRQGALSAFRAAAIKCHDVEGISEIAEEIITPLKTGKLPSADLRAHHAEMLALLPVSRASATKISSVIATVVGKEANEAALTSETLVLLHYARWGVQNGLDLDKQVIDAFTKGISDKKAPIKRLWTMRLGELFWVTEGDEVLQARLSKLAEAAIPALMNTWQEAISNPLAAAQSGLVTNAFVLIAIAHAKLARLSNSKVDAALKKAQIVKQALVMEPKPSFLLNQRIYGKLTSEDDFNWLIRALASTSDDIIAIDPSSPGTIAWSQAIIFCICSSTVKPDVRKEAAKVLSRLYLKHSSAISRILVCGLWRWRDSVESGDKDSAAVFAKTENNNIHHVVRSICLSPAEINERNAKVEMSARMEQMTLLLVLSRPELLPRVSWIQLCLKVEVDPGNLARESGDALVQQILDCTRFDEKVRSTQDLFLHTSLLILCPGTLPTLRQSQERCFPSSSRTCFCCTRCYDSQDCGAYRTGP